MKNSFIISLFLVCLVAVSGCGNKLPKDFPKVYPISLTVTDGATPLSDVQVTFLRTVAGAGGNFSASGMTDANGVAVIQTSQGAYSANGIPAGEYVVTVDDYIKVDLGVTMEEAAAMSRAEQGELEKKRQELLKAYKRKVPENLCKVASKTTDRSPIRFTAKEGNNELKIDVSEYKK